MAVFPKRTDSTENSGEFNLKVSGFKWTMHECSMRISSKDCVNFAENNSQERKIETIPMEYYCKKTKNNPR